MEMYNKAIQLLKQQNFLKAEQLLFQLSKEAQQTDEVKWALGLIQVYVGKPYKAIEYWQTVKDVERYEIEKNLEKIKKVLPSYDQLYQTYNEALTHIKEKQYEQALANFSECIKFKDALPLEIYEGYMNLAYYLDKDDLVEEMLKHAPKHVLAANEIQRILLVEKNTNQLLQKSKQLQDDGEIYQKKIRDTVKQRNGVIGGAIGLAIALLATIIIVIVNKDSVVSDLVPIVANSDMQIEAVSKVEQDIDQEVIEKLEYKIATLEEQLIESTLSNEKLNEREILLHEKGISLDTLLIDAQKKQYQLGYYFYQNGQYKASQDLLQKSLQFEQDVYYADDAHYYLIQSKIRTGDTYLQRDYDSFINNEYESYQQSPYFDDILLQYARFGIDNGNNELAKQLLKRIIREYSQEWTAKRATKLLNELAEL